MKLPDARLHLVVDPSDLPEHTTFIQSLHDQGERRIVCEIRPDGRGSLDWLAAAVLRGLGKKSDRAGTGRNAQVSWRRATAWAAAADLQHLFVSRAQLLTRRDLQALIDLAVLADCDLWLIQQSERPPRQVRDALNEIPLRCWSFEQFRRHWAEAAAETEQPAKTKAKTAAPKTRRTVSYSELPADEFPTFLATCEELLPAKQFHDVESDFERAFRETTTWLKRAKQPDTDAHAFVIALLENRQTRPEMIVALRAAQVAFFHQRLLLKADIDRLLAQRAAMIDDKRSDDVAEAVATYASTSHAAAATICFFQRDPTLRKAAALTVGDIGADGSLVNGEAVPDPLRVPLRAQRLMRLLDGAAESEALFVTEKKLKNGDARSIAPTSARGLQTLVRAVTRESGLPLVVRYEVSRKSSEQKWALAVGLAVQPLRPINNPRERTVAERKAA